MSIYAQGSLLGHYTPSTPNELSNGTYVIGHEFASRELQEDSGIANVAIAEFIVNDYSHLRIFAAERIAAVINQIAPHVELAGVFSGPSTNTLASEGGTWGELQQAIAMVGNRYERPIIAAQSRHAPRIAKQAQRLGLNPLLPPNLPELFDPESAQWWCRGSLRWAARELIGAIELRRRKQL